MLNTLLPCCSPAAILPQAGLQPKHVLQQNPTIQDSPHLPQLFCCAQVAVASGGVSMQGGGGGGGGGGAVSHATSEA
jgi:hypothetical protein